MVSSRSRSSKTSHKSPTEIDLHVVAMSLFEEHAGDVGTVAVEMGISEDAVEKLIVKAREIERVETSPKKQRLEKIFLDFVATRKRIPTVADLAAAGAASGAVNAAFGGQKAFENRMWRLHEDEMKKHVVHERSIRDPKRMEKIETAIIGCKTFAITTAVAGKRGHYAFISALDHYLKKRDGSLLILPCEDAAARGKSQDVSLDQVFADRHVVTAPVRINDNVVISAIRMSAKQMEPLRGLDGMTQRDDASVIVASTKQDLRYVPQSSGLDRHPHALMTTGACTVNDYSTDMYMSMRTSYIATYDHVIGAIVIDAEDDKFYHFRQIQASEDGSFVDLCVRYHPDGTETPEPAHLIMGDWHAGKTDPLVKEAAGRICREMPIEAVVLHDFIDSDAVNPFDEKYPLKMVKKMTDQRGDLAAELQIGVSDIDWWHDQFDGQVIAVRSNHDEFIDGWILRNSWSTDNINWHVGHEMAPQVRDGLNPIEHWFAKRVKNPDRLTWLTRFTPYKVGGVDLSQHGDRGFNGSKGDLRSLEKAFGPCVAGHTHTAEKRRGVTRVGTSTPRRADYERSGANNWTQTCCLQYRDGSNQLLNFINGRYLPPRTARPRGRRTNSLYRRKIV